MNERKEIVKSPVTEKAKEREREALLEECGKVMRQDGVKIVRELGWMNT